MDRSNECDVFVAGGGPAGIGAALAAARNGARVLLAEGTNCLGGMLTNGLVAHIRTAGDNGGIIHEFQTRCVAAGGGTISATHAQLVPAVARVVAFEMMREAKVRLLLHTLACGVETSGPAVQGVWIANKGGRQLVRCRAAVDCTGDADLAAWAGVPCDKGRAEDGALQAVSLNFQLAGVDLAKRPPWEEFQKVWTQGVESGELDLPLGARKMNGGAQLAGYPADVLHFQFDLSFGIDASDPASLTDGEVVCHQRVLKIWSFLRKHFEAYRNSLLINVATYLGVRETRRIRGEKTLTEADVLEARKHPDGIARCSWYMDLHDGQDKHPLPEYRARRAPPPGEFYEIPYGCLVPLRIDGLLVSGRSISSTRPANGSLRLQPTCMNTGQAAGAAAALCAARGIQPRALAGAELRSILAGQGMEI